MDQVLKNKHVLGGLTLCDLKQTVESLRLWSVEIDGQLYERFVFRADGLKVWTAEEQYIDDDGDLNADIVYDLDMPAKVRDGKVIVTDLDTGVEDTLVFGQTAFVPTKIEIA